jgi:hypothetical protein
MCSNTYQICTKLRLPIIPLPDQPLPAASVPRILIGKHGREVSRQTPLPSSHQRRALEFVRQRRAPRPYSLGQVTTVAVAA